MFYRYKLIEIRNSSRETIAKFNRKYQAELALNALATYTKDWKSVKGYQVIYKNKAIISQ